MPSHAVAFSESVDQTLDNITPVEDAILTKSGDDLLIPPDLHSLAALYVGGASMERARLVTAYLRQRLPGGGPDFQPVDTNADPGDLAPHFDFSLGPMRLVDGASGALDRLNVQIENDGAAGAVDASALCLLTDRALVPTPAATLAECRPVRWTGTVTSVAETWTSHSITLAQNLPPGRYECHGVRYQGSTAKFWRHIPNTGGAGAYRPGWLCQNADTERAWGLGLPGKMGKLFDFRSDALPSFEVLADTAAAQSPQGLLYVRRVGD